MIESKLLERVGPVAIIVDDSGSTAAVIEGQPLIAQLGEAVVNTVRRCRKMGVEAEVYCFNYPSPYRGRGSIASYMKHVARGVSERSLTKPCTLMLRVLQICPSGLYVCMDGKLECGHEDLEATEFKASAALEEARKQIPGFQCLFVGVEVPGIKMKDSAKRLGFREGEIILAESLATLASDVEKSFTAQVDVSFSSRSMTGNSCTPTPVQLSPSPFGGPDVSMNSRAALAAMPPAELERLLNELKLKRAQVSTVGTVTCTNLAVNGAGQPPRLPGPTT